MGSFTALLIVHLKVSRKNRTSAEIRKSDTTCVISLLCVPRDIIIKFKHHTVCMKRKSTNSTPNADDAKILELCTGATAYESLFVFHMLLILYMYVVSGDNNQFSAMELSQVEDHTFWTEYDVKNSHYLVQPSVIRPTPSKSLLRAFFRDRRAEHIYSAISFDEGILYIMCFHSMKVYYVLAQSARIS